MTGKPTATAQRFTERHKARARLVLLTLAALLCPPVAGVRSAPVWALYVAFAVLYSLWTLRLVHRFGQDQRLGYLLALTDAAVLLPLGVWSSSVLLRTILVLLCAAGAVYTYLAAQRARRMAAYTEQGTRLSRYPEGVEARVETPEARLTRALRTRLELFGSTGTRFALVLLHIVRYQELLVYYGDEMASQVVAAVSLRGLRTLGPDAQSFVLAGGKVAFVFALEPAKVDAYDVEGLAMGLARKTCEHLVDRYRVECVVGWASPPADGLSAEDLLYTAESGLRSAEAFRRVAGAPAATPGKTRAAAG